MYKYLSKTGFIAIVFLCFLAPKVYFLKLSYENNLYSDEAAYSAGDASHYLRIAKNIFQFGVYSDTNSETLSESATWRPPLWPYVLSSFFYVTETPFGLIIVKSILELLLLLVSLSLIKRFVKHKSNSLYFVFFLILFIEPYYLKYSTTFLSESLSAIFVLLLSISFILFCYSKKYSISIPILSLITILCHPVSVFFVLTLLLIYGILNLKLNLRGIIFHAILFISLALLWPLRNQLMFDQGVYLTASQGATFSKGWNEDVINNYTNVDGDLADESLNLKYIDDLDLQKNISVLELGKLYKKGTLNFINSLSFQEVFQITFVKLKSNFNPFPEKPKPGTIENIAIFFRILYLIVFFQCLYNLIKNRRIGITSKKDKVHLVVLSILAGQIFMSVFIYTGLRFNAIYGLTLLFCFLYLNMSFFISKAEKFRNLLITSNL